MAEERAIEFVTARDRAGNDHQFDLNASALRRITRRLREVTKADPDETQALIESVFITVWESRVDKSQTDEEAYFARWTAKQLRNIVASLQKEHQPESDPTAPEAGTSATPATAG